MNRKAFQILIFSVILTCSILLFCACNPSSGNNQSSSVSESSSSQEASTSSSEEGSTSSNEEGSASSNEEGSTSSGDSSQDEHVLAILKFEKLTGGTYSVVGLSNPGATKIVIPDMYEGEKVTTIASEAFRGCSSVKSLTIGCNINSIGDLAFYYCDYLTEINYNATMCADLNLENNVFHDAGKNSQGITVTIGNNVKKIPANLFYASFAYLENLPRISRVLFENGSVCEEIGSSAFEKCVYLQDAEIPNCVTAIGNSAFKSCYLLENIEIPSSVVSIGAGAFSSCNYLKSVTFEEGSVCETIGEEAFYKSVLIKHIEIPNSVTSIGDDAFSGCSSLEFNEYDTALYLGNNTNPYLVLVTAISTPFTSCEVNASTKFICSLAFYDCNSLEEITIGRNVISIGENAFRSCNALEEIVVDENNTHFASHTGVLYNKEKTEFIHVPKAIKGEIVIPEGISSIGTGIFAGLELFSSVIISNTVTDIESDAFYDCALESVTIGESVESIGDYAFAYCNLLESVTIPNSVTSIGKYAFRDCTSLASVTINDSTATLGAYSFTGCTSLSSLTIGKNITSIGNGTFSGCSLLSSITIGEKVETIGNRAFFGCVLLESVTIESITVTIADEAFSGCSSLYSVDLGNGVTSIGVKAFVGCEYLKSIVLPNSLTLIGSHAFSTLLSATFENPQNWVAVRYENITLLESDLSNVETAATYLSDTYGSYTWKQVVS